MNREDRAYDLAGQVALITGAGRGIGKAIARRLGAAGALVIVFDIDESALTATARELSAEGCNAQARVLDVADFEAVQCHVSEILIERGRIDILVNCAGILHTKSFEALSEAEWDLMLKTNLKGVFNFFKAVVGPMKRQCGGKIVSISSLSGKSGGISVSADYAVSKAGVIVLSRCLARDLAPYGVNVNCVAPGLTDTNMNASLGSEQMRKVIESIPLGRMAKPEEIAELVLFLSSQASDYITGETVNINGGLLMD